MSFALGPFALSIGQIVFISAFFIAFVIAWIGSRGKTSRADNTLINALIVGFVSARLVFVIRYWSDYQTNILQIFDIRDRGFDLLAGVVAAIILILVVAVRQRVQRSALLVASFAGGFSWLLATVMFYPQQSALPDLPDYALVDQHGETVQMSEFQGQAVVVNLWASWCGPCRREMPVIADAQTQYPDVHFLLVNQGESAGQVALFLHEESLELANILLDPGNVLSTYWRVRGLPTTLFFDDQGRYSHHHFGELSSASLRYQLEKLN